LQPLSSVSRQQTAAEDEHQPADLKLPPKGPVKRASRLARFARATLKTVATLLILAIALLAALIIWDFYVAAPWTRDGSIRVQVANVAPQVSGQITEIRVVDNQFVHQGDVLYVIDPFDFQVALDSQKAQLRAAFRLWRLSTSPFDRFAACPGAPLHCVRHGWGHPSRSKAEAGSGLIVSSNRLSRRQLIKQRLGLLKVERIEPLGKPPVDRSEKFASLLRLVLVTPELCAYYRDRAFEGCDFDPLAIS
jgi:Biotin-lipoyl like